MSVDKSITKKILKLDFAANSDTICLSFHVNQLTGVVCVGDSYSLLFILLEWKRLLR